MDDELVTPDSGKTFPAGVFCEFSMHYADFAL
jgi:hypothetical protein